MIFTEISADENDQLLAAPALIAVLLGLADGKFGEQEKIWAEKLIVARTFSKPEFLQPFYKKVSEGIWQRLSTLAESLPSDAETRNSLISNQLANLNPILAKFDERKGAGIYRSFRLLAEEVAKAEGGFLRFGAINADEKKWVELPMIMPILSEKLKTELQQDDSEEKIED